MYIYLYDIQVLQIKISKFQPEKKHDVQISSPNTHFFWNKNVSPPVRNLLRNFAQVTGGVDFAAGHTRAAGDKWSAPGTTRLTTSVLMMYDVCSRSYQNDGDFEVTMLVLKCWISWK